MGEPITKEEREAMRLEAEEFAERRPLARDIIRLLDALEATEAEAERMREAAQVAEDDAQRLTTALVDLIARVGNVLAAAGCDCDHGPSCPQFECECNPEPCLGCRVEAAMKGARP